MQQPFQIMSLTLSIITNTFLTLLLLRTPFCKKTSPIGHIKAFLSKLFLSFHLFHAKGFWIRADRLDGSKNTMLGQFYILNLKPASLPF